MTIAGAPTALLAKVSVPYTGFMAMTFTDFIDVPELLGGVSVGGLLIWTIRLSFAQHKSNVAELKDIITELRKENDRLRDNRKPEGETK